MCIQGTCQINLKGRVVHSVLKKKKRKKRVTAALIHGLKKVRVQAHFNKPEMQIQAFEIKSFTVHHSSLKTSLPYQGMEIVQTMNSDPGLAVGKVYLAFLPEYHFQCCVQETTRRI